MEQDSIVKLVKRCIRWEHQSYRQKLIYYRLATVLANLICLIPFPIAWLFRFFGSDKDREGDHLYGTTYGTILRRFRYRRIKLLEIGIGGYGTGLGGSSLLAWQAFFPFAKIVACDIVPKVDLETWRVSVYMVDQSSPTDLARLIKEQAPFDVVIDDGSHQNSHQIFTFSQLFDSINDGGIYIIEDVQTSFWPGSVGLYIYDGRHINDPEFSQTCVGSFLELAKYLNYQEFLDNESIDARKLSLAKNIKRISFEHNLIIVDKGPNNAPSRGRCTICSKAAR